MNIINETEQEKVFILKKLAVKQNDSIKVVNSSEGILDLINYGSEKIYELEVSFAVKQGLGRFINNNIDLNQNTKHIINPNWEDFAAMHLTIYVDNGNDGTLDDIHCFLKMN